MGSEHPFIQLFSMSTGECLLKLEGHANRYSTLLNGLYVHQLNCHTVEEFNFHTNHILY